MNVASVSRNSGSYLHEASQRIGQGVTDRPGIEAIDAIRGKITPNQMSAAIPERRPATEEISGVIGRVHLPQCGQRLLSPAGEKRDAKRAAPSIENHATLLRLPGGLRVLFLALGPCHRSSSADADGVW
jgi:hypothetical protein